MMSESKVPSAFLALLLVLGLASLCPRPLLADEGAYQLADIDQTPDPPFTPFPKEPPSDFFALGDRLLFATIGSVAQEGILWSTDGTAAGTVQLSSSICPADYNRIRHLTTWHGIALLEVTDAATGAAALARTDGTTAGTFVLIGGLPGAPSYYPTEVAAPPGAAYFFFPACSFQPSCELWRSDGTAGGTTIVRDAGGLFLTGPHSLTVWGDKVALIAYAGDEGATDLWTTDGTPAGTLLLSEVTESFDSYSRIVATPSKLFFASGETGEDLWVTDGARGSARQLADFDPVSCSFQPTECDVPDVNSMTADGDGVLFKTLRKGHGAEIWWSDGTVAGTRPLLELPAGIGVGDTPHRLGSRWIFPAGPTNQPVLWTAGDGFAGAAPLAGCAGGCPTFRGFAAPPDGGSQLFAGEDADHGIELWSTDGTPAGTRRLTDACPGVCSGIHLIFDLAPGAAQTAISGPPGSAWFHAFPSADSDPFDPDAGDELWFTDGTPAGTHRVAGHTMDVGFLGTRTFFGRFNGRRPATELWTATEAAGSARRVTVLRRLAPGSLPQLMPFQGGALLLPSDPADVAQLWRSDGTPAGTVPFFSFSPGSGRSFYTLFPPVGPVQLAVVQHQDGQHRSFEIWRTDGSARGTRPLLQLDPRQVLYLDTAAWDGKVLFNVGDPDGCAFWSSDGTAAGTRQILPPMPKLDCPSAKIAFGSRFVFVAAVGARPDHRTPQIFISDGTAAGTHQLTALQKIVSPVFEDRPVVVGGIVFLRLNDAFGHPEIWRTDGTPGRTRRAFPLTDADNLFAFGASLYFTALLADGSGSSGVFRASSSDRSPTLLATVDQMEVDSGTVSFTPLGDQLVFAAGDPDLGSELWSTDGTPAGTRLLADVDPGPRSSMPTGFVPAGDRVFFSADDGTHGLELWETDGTTEGTRRRTDIAPGGFSSLLRYSNPVVSNGFVFFNADDAVTGAEPWALPLEPR